MQKERKTLENIRTRGKGRASGKEMTRGNERKIGHGRAKGKEGQEEKKDKR